MSLSKKKIHLLTAGLLKGKKLSELIDIGFAGKKISLEIFDLNTEIIKKRLLVARLLKILVRNLGLPERSLPDRDYAAQFPDSIAALKP